MQSTVRTLCVLHAMLVLLALVVLGCDSVTSDTRSKVAKQPSGLELGVGYPAGPWWRGDMNETLLSVSHILISHRQAENEARLMWVPKQHVARSRDEARSIALQLAARLRDHAEGFTSAARMYSDDLATRALGGALGEVYAPSLPAPIVDALGNLRAGQISRVVETKLGFHIIRRGEVKPARALAAHEITIAYRGTKLPLRIGRSVGRSRDEAWALAQQLAQTLRREPERFDALVQVHSDAFSAEQGGDYGAWSSHDHFQDPFTLHVIAGLRPGEISGPVETRQGFRLFKRTPEERDVVAGRLFAIAYVVPQAEQVPEISRTREQALAEASLVAGMLSHRPDRFDELRGQHCDHRFCENPAIRLQQGSGVVGAVASRLREVAIGVPLSGWVELPGLLVFAQRAALDTAAAEPAAPPVDLELPTPGPVTLDSATNQQLVWYVGQLRKLAEKRLALEAVQAEGFTRVMDELMRGYATSPVAARAALWRDASGELLAVLGPEKSQALALLNDGLMMRVMGRRDTEPAPAPQSAAARPASNSAGIP